LGVRVAIGGFVHETNTFHPEPTTLADFQGPNGTWLHGTALIEAFGDTPSVLGGMLDVAAEAGWQVVPTFFAAHPPIKGLVKAEAAAAIREQLVAGLIGQQLDGVLLFLHGACAAEGVADPEAAVLAAVRRVIGPALPLIVVFDLHANIGPAWAEYANALIGYKTAPHTDFYERGREGAEVMRRTLSGELRPVVALAKPPIMIKAGLMSMTNAQLALIKPPMFWLMQRGLIMEREPAVINVSIAAGFGDADTPATGMTMLVTTNNEPGLAQRYADELCRLAWRLRRGLDTELVMTPVTTAVERAATTDDWPVILADQGNNTAGGSPGDGTAILAALKAADWPDAALFLRDEAAVAAAWAAGVGQTIEVSVGGKYEPLNGGPVTVSGVVRLIAEPTVAHVTGGPGARLGRTAVLRCGQTDLVLTERATSQTHPGYFRAVGIEPRDRRIIVVQSAHLFRAAFEVKERIPRMIIEVDSPGITSPTAQRFTYHQLPRPIYPLDEFVWPE
jgi:microcystin degradation protein MlrC